MSSLFYEDYKLAAHIPADSESTAVNSGWLEWGPYHDAVVIISVGDMVATSTFDVAVQQATSAAGAGAKALNDFEGNAIATTQLTAAGGDGNQAIVIHLRSEYLDVDGGYTHFRVVFTPATAAVEFGAFVLLGNPRFRPISTYATDWQEVVHQN